MVREVDVEVAEWADAVADAVAVLLPSSWWKSGGGFGNYSFEMKRRGGVMAVVEYHWHVLGDYE